MFLLVLGWFHKYHASFLRTDVNYQSSVDKRTGEILCTYHSLCFHLHHPLSLRLRFEGRGEKERGGGPDCQPESGIDVLLRIQKGRLTGRRAKEANEAEGRKEEEDVFGFGWMNEPSEPVENACLDFASETLHKAVGWLLSLESLNFLLNTLNLSPFWLTMTN